jgi:hypothetical protein
MPDFQIGQGCSPEGTLGQGSPITNLRMERAFLEPPSSLLPRRRWSMILSENRHEVASQRRDVGITAQRQERVRIKEGAGESDRASAPRLSSMSLMSRHDPAKDRVTKVCSRKRPLKFVHDADLAPDVAKRQTACCGIESAEAGKEGSSAKNTCWQSVISLSPRPHDRSPATILRCD